MTDELIAISILWGFILFTRSWRQWTLEQGFGQWYISIVHKRKQRKSQTDICRRHGK